jgi:protein SCO1
MNTRLTIIALAALTCGGTMAFFWNAPLTKCSWSTVGGARGGALPATGKALVGGPFSLIDHTGKRVTDQDFRGRHMLVFFGYTFCPDICPSGLQVISAALDKLGPAADGLTPLFITIDPERDTPEKLAAYVKSFHPRLLGLTGTPAEVAAVVKAYRVYARKVADEQHPKDYTMDHSSILYVMGPDGGMTAFAPDLTKLDTVVEQIKLGLAGCG